MALNIRTTLVCLVAILLLPNQGQGEDVTTLIKKYCFDCHGGDSREGNEDLDLLDASTITDEYSGNGELSDSYIWQRISDGEMPPEDSLQPTESEKEVFKQWIIAGAKFSGNSKSGTVEKEKTAEAEPSDQESTSETIAKLDSDELAKAGVDILNAHCKSCHGDEKRGNPALDVTDRNQLVAGQGKDDKYFLVEGDPDKSFIWERVAKKQMPPKGSIKRDPQLALTDQKRAILRQWIEAGAPFPTGPGARGEFFDESKLWEVVNTDLRNSRESDRRFFRYLSLANVYNNFQRYSNSEFTAHQAAISKVVNSLSWESSITNPTKLDDEGIVWRIDMRDYGWHEMDYADQEGYQGTSQTDAWSILMHEYPYGIEFRNPQIDDQQVRQKLSENFRDAQKYTSCSMPVLRGDWFVFHASQSDLYYLISRIPFHVGKLEQMIGVNVKKDFMDRKLIRAGVKESGVSNGNRLMDRHQSQYGYYWKSYDFARGTDNLDQLPLGPAFSNHPYPRFAFEHDGGEMIFSLPNGLQGYVLATGDDRRLELGPSEVVRDDEATGGTGQVNNAISCMNCHAGGMRNFDDTIRTGMVVQGDARNFADDLYDPRDQLKRVLDKDSKKFMAAARTAMSAAFEDDENQVPEAYFSAGTEPVKQVARTYLKSLNATDVAYELGLQQKDGLSNDRLISIKIDGNRDLQRLGLATLAKNGKVRRETWESMKAGTSIAQIAAQKLGYGGSVDARTAATNRIFRAYNQLRVEGN